MDTNSALAELPVDERTATAAFSSYRAYLKSLSKNRADGRSGPRKQSALRVVSERYRIPIGQLKRLVQAMEEECGIVHSHTESYERELVYRKRAAELEKTNTGACPLCDDRRDRWSLRGDEGPDEVKVRVNPYEIEIYGNFKPMLSCLGCYFDIETDI